MPSITMSELARKLGLSQATVSRALRNHGSVAEATRRRVQAAAERYGYRRNPLVSALMVSRRRRQPRAETKLTYIEVDTSGQRLLRTGRIYRQIFAGIAARAAELGYALERLEACAPGVTPARFRSIIKSRGIENVIISPLVGGATGLDLDYQALRAVTIGLSLPSPELHCVRSGHYANSETALRQAIRLGYRRIGYVGDLRGSARLGHRWLGAYLSSRETHPTIFHAPPLMTETNETELTGLLSDYLRAHRSEVLVTPDHVRLSETLSALGLAVPADIAVISVNGAGHGGGLTGIDEDFVRQGREVVDLLAGEILQQRFGVPESRRDVVVPGIWVPGATAPGRK
jgi:DNA-binding LacI/PurR family transcriptional regulator